MSKIKKMRACDFVFESQIFSLTELRTWLLHV